MNGALVISLKVYLVYVTQTIISMMKFKYFFIKYGHFICCERVGLKPLNQMNESIFWWNIDLNLCFMIAIQK